MGNRITTALLGPTHAAPPPDNHHKSTSQQSLRLAQDAPRWVIRGCALLSTWRGNTTLTGPNSKHSSTPKNKSASLLRSVASCNRAAPDRAAWCSMVRPAHTSTPAHPPHLLACGQIECGRAPGLQAKGVCYTNARLSCHLRKEVCLDAQACGSHQHVCDGRCACLAI